MDGRVMGHKSRFDFFPGSEQEEMDMFSCVVCACCHHFPAGHDDAPPKLEPSLPARGSCRWRELIGMD